MGLSTNFTCVHRICTLVVFLGFLHLCFMLLYYLRGLDIRASFVRFQQDQLSEPNQTERTSTATELGAPEPTTKLDMCADTPPDLDGTGKLELPDVLGAAGSIWYLDLKVANLNATFGCNAVEQVGPLRVEFSQPVSMETIRAENPSLQEGGRYKPKECIALQKVAIIIPFRHRDEHLKFWLYYLHPILRRQQLDYGVYVINQDGESTFNRAKLFNIGYVEALKDYDYECFIFSDVDLIPMDDRNIYKCSSQPRHLSVAVDKFGFRLPYTQIFGGVSALTKEQYLAINGFSNDYWGWGGEDDDIYQRLASKGMSISRPDSIVGKYRMIVHNRDEKNEANPKRFEKLQHTINSMNNDGANSLVYQVIRVEKDSLYTKVTVDVGKPAN